MKHEIQAVISIAYRDILRFLRDRPRIAISFIFPFIFIGVLGQSFNSSVAKDLPFDYLTFVFTGVLGQTLFQSTASGIISMIEDRENNFTQEIFVSPISRYTILIGKILGESLVSFAQIVGILVFGLVLGIAIPWSFVLLFLPVGLVAALLGGSFGVLVLANLSNQRSANQVFPFLILPQFFLAGVFNPISDLPWYLFALSRIAPMTYAIDIVRNLYYFGSGQAEYVVLYSAAVDLLIIAVLFTVFLTIGTALFVRNERNK